jgi:hypothetical protein
LIQFAVKDELMRKFEALKIHLAHKNHEGRWDFLFSKLADLALQKSQAKTQPEKRTDPNSKQEKPAQSQADSGKSPAKTFGANHNKFIAERIFGQANFSAFAKPQHVDVES